MPSTDDVSRNLKRSKKLLAMPHMLELAACARGKPSADCIFKLHGRFVRDWDALASLVSKHAKNAGRGDQMKYVRDRGDPSKELPGISAA